MTRAFFARADGVEHRMCRLASRICQRFYIRKFFRGVSRLGDGVFWFTLIAMMPLIIGLDRLREGVAASMHMLAAGALGLIIYKLLKRKLVRERPFVSFENIECAMPPLDRYSFPSGHTLHAVLFTTIAVGYAPELTFLLVPFALLVAASRVFLGLHYPSDVMVGAVLGWFIARLTRLMVFV